MSRNEFFSPLNDASNPFEPVIEYKGPQTPTEIAEETTLKMEKYFSEPAFWNYHKGYLESNTLGLIEAARRGFLANPKAVRNLGLIEPETLSALDMMNKQYTEDDPDTEDAEAFSRMYIAFGIVPEIAVREGLPSGYSRSLMLAPPFTTAEVFGRIHEVEVTIGRMKEGRLQREVDVTNMPGVLRTYWAFRAIASMPLRSPFAEGVEFARETIEAINDSPSSSLLG